MPARARVAITSCSRRMLFWLGKSAHDRGADLATRAGRGTCRCGVLGWSAAGNLSLRGAARIGRVRGCHSRSVSAGAARSAPEPRSPRRLALPRAGWPGGGIAATRQAVGNGRNVRCAAASRRRRAIGRAGARLRSAKRRPTRTAHRSPDFPLATHCWLACYSCGKE
jgi:hypothetical protein